jgi:hypothetical protein
VKSSNLTGGYSLGFELKKDLIDFEKEIKDIIK